MHAFAMHTSEFIKLHGNFVSFMQQGLEKLNDVTTKQYERYHGLSALKQVLLEKRNRIEILQDSGYDSEVQARMCSKCKSPGHNKRTCKEQLPA